MSDSPDPKIVREIARKLLLDPHMTHSDFKACIRDHIGADAPDETFSAWYNAVRADAYKGTVETVALWPDEQPQDAHPLDPARKTCSVCGHYFLAHRNDVGCIHCECKAGIAAGRKDEQPQDDGDVRAVRRLLMLVEADTEFSFRPAAMALRHRFADRIAALEARDATAAARERVAELAEHAEEER